MKRARSAMEETGFQRQVRRRREGSEERPLPLKSGNNKYGASGTNKCGHCREKKFKCVYDPNDINSKCEKCQLSNVECGPKLSAKEYREQQEQEAAIEAARRAHEQDASATGLVIRGSPSPRSFRVFTVVRESTKRALETQERDPQIIIERIANDLQTHSQALLQSSSSLAASPNPIRMPMFEQPLSLEGFPTAMQQPTYSIPQGQTTYGIGTPVAPGFPLYSETPPLGNVQQFQGQLAQQQMGGTHPTQPQGQWQWPWGSPGGPGRGDARGRGHRGGTQ